MERQEGGGAAQVPAEPRAVRAEAAAGVPCRAVGAAPRLGRAVPAQKDAGPRAQGGRRRFGCRGAEGEPARLARRREVREGATARRAGAS